MESDRVIVLDAGKVREFDTPKNLLRNTSGHLRSLVEESENKIELYAMAGVM